MCDDERVKGYLLEADQHICGAENLLRDLSDAGPTDMRQMRAALYLKAMRRLRRLIEVHQTLPWNQAATSAPGIGTDPGRRARWPMPWRAKVAPDQTSRIGSDG